MVQRRENLSLALKSGEALGVGGKRYWQYFDRDEPLQIDVLGPIDLAHATASDGGLDRVRPKLGAGIKWHLVMWTALYRQWPLDPDAGIYARVDAIEQTTDSTTQAAFRRSPPNPPSKYESR